MNGEEFLKAVKVLEDEKHIDRDVVFEAMEQGLNSAYKKNYGMPNSKVVINKETGEIKVYSYKTVVDDVYKEDEEEEVIDEETGEVVKTNNKNKYNGDPNDIKISLEDARKIDKRYNIGDTVDTLVTPKDFGRVAAATAKQVVVQKIREAERESLVNEFKDKEGELVQGILELEDEGNYYINLGRTNGILSKNELIGDEKLEMETSVKAYVSKVESGPKGTVIFLTRKHPNFVKRLFELSIPELNDGSVMIMGVARDAGIRSKVSVYSQYANIDPIGCCIGEKGSRISNIIKELNGEKLDIIKYDEDKEKYISNALSPAKNVRVFILDPKKQEALAIADGEDFSLALGKKGSNVRLASKLTKYKIDVKTKEQASEMGITLK